MNIANSIARLCRSGTAPNTMLSTSKAMSRAPIAKRMLTVRAYHFTPTIWHQSLLTARHVNKPEFQTDPIPLHALQFRTHSPEPSRFPGDGRWRDGQTLEPRRYGCAFGKGRAREARSVQEGKATWLITHAAVSSFATARKVSVHSNGGARNRYNGSLLSEHSLRKPKLR